MAQIILHGGRHKSGTTALQKFLRTHSGLLERYGYYYPAFGIRGFGHHDVAGPLTRAAMRDKSDVAQSARQKTASMLQAELSAQASIPVISSEGFQNCDPVDVSRFFANWDCKVVFYIREQVSYLLSAYAQKIHATLYTGTLEEFYYSEFRRGDYSLFLKQWQKQFSDNLIVRVYDRSQLQGSNVVFDFCQQILGIDPQALQGQTLPDSTNPSLTNHLLVFKRLINASPGIAKEHQHDIYLGLSELALNDKSGPLTMGKKLAEEVTEHYRDSNVSVAQDFFGREILFEPSELKGNAIHEPTTDELDAIRTKLVTLRPRLEQALPAFRKSA